MEILHDDETDPDRRRAGSRASGRRRTPGPEPKQPPGREPRHRQASVDNIDAAMRDEATFRVKAGLAEMLKGGVIMDVVNAEQAKIAEDAGAAAVMALERVPADIRRDGGVARMSDPIADQGHPGGRDDPGHGQGAHRPLRRGAGARGARGRLHRRVRGAHARGRGQPHRQVGLQGAVRVRRDQPRRGAAPDRRGRGDDPLQGRGRHRRHRRGRAPPARASAARSAACGRSTTWSSRPPPRSCSRRWTSCARSPRTASCRSCCSAPAASPPRRTRRW